MEKVRKPLFVLIYEGKDITKDISEIFDSISYTDYLSGMSDEISISLENRDGRWFKSWMPQKADRLKLYLGYESSKLLNCGIFIIDEISYGGFPDKIDLKGSSFPYESPNLHKTKKRRTFENTTLNSIVSGIAKENSLQPFVKIEPDVDIKRIDQFDETDATFLTRIAEDYGYFIKFAEEKLIFSKFKNLEDEPASFTIKKDEIVSYMVKDTIHTLYKEAIVEYFDHKEQKLKTYTFHDPNIKWGETLKINESVDNLVQAQEKAKAALRARNMLSAKVTLELMGDTRLVAGLTVNIEGFGNYDGKYIISSSTHTLDSSGYITSVELKKCLSY
ncbi:hypothetical protein FHQ18_11675 [Deferribacter autotrophicus]|uniref:YqbQ/XkdQ domain-containing protein n=1 Tax=Deferribacter autotrophicus TaxID=500465 RepID=A0A5A8F5T2_9BACT|nr:contractile injection system protein, VgrG/Pvc8 family [Deferribacter autotrophicus]KAA0257217.1 hypothetical protein FHQ18_11675 [Deferribacter autotrophicus]